MNKKPIDEKLLEKLVKEKAQDACEATCEYRSTLNIEETTLALSEKIEKEYDVGPLLISLLKTTCKKAVKNAIHRNRFNEWFTKGELCADFFLGISDKLILSGPGEYVSMKSATISMIKEAMYRSMKNRKVVDSADDNMQDRGLMLIDTMEKNNCSADLACHILAGKYSSAVA